MFNFFKSRQEKERIARQELDKQKIETFMKEITEYVDDIIDFIKYDEGYNQEYNVSIGQEINYTLQYTTDTIIDVCLFFETFVPVIGYHSTIYFYYDSDNIFKLLTNNFNVWDVRNVEFIRNELKIAYNKLRKEYYGEGYWT